MFDTSSGISGAASGAQLGSAFGPWGAAAGAGIGYFVGKRVSSINKKAAKKQVANYNQLTAFIDSNRNALAAQLTEFNNQLNAQAREQRDEANKRLIQQTAVANAEIWKERTYVLKNTNAALSYIDRSSGQSKADISVQNAAADAIGASAAVQYSNVDAQADMARAAAYDGQEVELDNLLTGSRSLLEQARNMVDTSLIIDDVAEVSSTQPLLYAGSGNNSMSSLLGIAQTGAIFQQKGTFKEVGSFLKGLF